MAVVAAGHPGRRKVTANSAKSSAASGYSTPSFSARRFDHLIGEQQTLVRNAQESLKQSLDTLQRGTTKEEQDSARLQVDALLSRCEELLIKLQVVTAIRQELAATQSEITEKKKKKESVSGLYQRQQWLEKRLQGLLLARYRGRPAARGRRAALPTVNLERQDLREHSRVLDQSRVSRVSIGESTGRGLLSTQVRLPDRRAMMHQRHQSIVTTISDITTGYTMSIPSSAGRVRGVVFDSDDEETSTDSDMSSDESTSCTSESSAITRRSLQESILVDTTKKHDGDSDEWYSESEANWTITQSKQVTPSQPDSSKQVTPSQTDSSKQVTPTHPDSSKQVTPSQTDSSKQVTPSQTDSSKQVTPSQTDSSKQVTPSQTDSSKQVTPSQTDSSKQVTPSQTDSSKQVTPSQPDSSKRVTPSQTDSSKQVTPSQTDSSKQVTPSQTDSSKQVTPSQPDSSKQATPSQADSTKSTSSSPDEENAAKQLIDVSPSGDECDRNTPHNSLVTDDLSFVRPITRQHKNVDVCNEYGFERPRSAKLFGSQSWNMLSLAKFTNYVEATPIEVNKSQLANTQQLLETGLVELVEDVAELSQQVQVVAKVMVEGGRSVPPSRRMHRSSSVPSVAGRRSRVDSSCLRPPTTLKSSSFTLKLPPLKSKTGSIKFHLSTDSIYEPTGVLSKPSRKIFAKEGMDRMFPQPVTRWYRPETEGLVHVKGQSSDMNLVSSLVPKRLGYKGTHIARNIQNQINMEDEIAFEAEKHRMQRIELLKERLSSSTIDLRADAVQTLGILSPDSDTLETMITMLVQDLVPQVRFQVLKSLVKLGVFNGPVLAITTAILKKGTVPSQYELLSVLESDIAISSLKQNDIAGSEAQQELYDTLLHLMTSSSDEHISLSAAAILSRIGVHMSASKKHLTSCLSLANPLYQFDALSYLVDYHAVIDDLIVEIAFGHMESLYDWKHRLRAVNILKSAGSAVVKSGREAVLERLLKRLPNEPVLAVRRGIGSLLGELRMTESAETRLMKKLEKGNEVDRRQALISLSSLQLKGRSVVNILLDSLELDPSEHVKVQAVRVLSTIQSPSTAILSCLQRKAQGTGILAQECVKALRHLCC